MSMERIDFYTDYRKFLKDYYSAQKKAYHYFSYRYFCNKAGISSPALFKEVVAGKRNLTDRTTVAFIKGMGLSDGDASYFRTLVRFNQTENEQEKVRVLEQLRGLRRKVSRQLVPLDLYEYYTTWYFPVIRELACVLDWKGDFNQLARVVSPPIKKSEAKTAIGFLVDKGFLTVGALGRYQQTRPALTTGSEVSSMAIRTFNEIMAKKGLESIRQVPPHERDVRTVVAGVSKKSYGLIKEEIRDFISRVVRIVDDDKASDMVYAVNLQFFPLSSKNSEGDTHHEGT
jgi:uncharacterized protein (TIGR02147 family)